MSDNKENKIYQLYQELKQFLELAEDLPFLYFDKPNLQPIKDFIKYLDNLDSGLAERYEKEKNE